MIFHWNLKSLTQSRTVYFLLVDEHVCGYKKGNLYQDLGLL
jgi:hypothetical protein